MSKLLQEIRGFAGSGNRCPPPRSAALLLTQMRPRVIHTAMPRRSLSVTMIEPDSRDIPHPVKINLVKQTPPPTATLPSS